MNAITLLVALLFAQPQHLTGVPAPSIRYVSHIGDYDGQTWFRWQFSPDGQHFDVMFFDQTERRMLRYYATVTPEETVTFLDSIAFGPSDPQGIESGEGETPVVIDYADGRRCTARVLYRWTAQRTGARIVLTQAQQFVDVEGCQPDPSYFETHVFSAAGMEASIGPSWALRLRP